MSMFVGDREHKSCATLEALGVWLRQAIEALGQEEMYFYCRYLS